MKKHDALLQYNLYLQVAGEELIIFNYTILDWYFMFKKEEYTSIRIVIIMSAECKRVLDLTDRDVL
jgi:hypothetical protein